MWDPEAQLKWLKVFRSLNEAQRRWYAAQKAAELGYGGINRIRALTGLSRSTITKGLHELEERETLNATQRVRRPGGGRRLLRGRDPGIVRVLEEILEENATSDRDLLRWSLRSTRDLADEMRRRGCAVSPMTVHRLMREIGYTMLTTPESRQGSHLFEQQFHHLENMAMEFLRRGEPAISVDTKRVIKNISRIASEEDASHSERGVDETAVRLTVECIRHWWDEVGRLGHPAVQRLLIFLNRKNGRGHRLRSWKELLCGLCSELNMSVHVCHFPPGAFQWKYIVSHMHVSYTSSWRGQLLIEAKIAIELIGDGGIRDDGNETGIFESMMDARMGDLVAAAEPDDDTENGMPLGSYSITP